MQLKLSLLAQLVYIGIMCYSKPVKAVFAAKLLK